MRRHWYPIAVAVLCLAIGLAVGYRLGQRHPLVPLPHWGESDQIFVEDTKYCATIITPQGGTASQPARRIYHKVTCPFARRIDPSHRVFYDSPLQAEDDGCVPCKRCRPGQD